MTKLKKIIFYILFTLVCLWGLSALPEGVVSREGTNFYVDGGVFYFAGTNSYDLFTMNEADIDTRMAEMASDGVKVLRTWGWNHDTWHGFETEEGVYDEDQFMLFDYIMEAARANGIRVVIVLSGYWEAYGGIDTRLEWEGLPSGDHASRSVFFTNEGCKEQYKNYAAHFVNRINSISGMPYKEDPAVFAWQLMNEPRYQDATPNENSTGVTFRAWVDEMGAYIKSLDSNHMVSLGIEGHEARYGFGGDEGNPFIYSHQSPYIDYTTAHPYPTEEWADLTLEETENLVRAWIYDAHFEVGKPFVMDEFNVHTSVDRSEWWTSIFGVLEDEGAAGSCFWEYEGHNVESNFGVNHGDAELVVFSAHSDAMSAKSTGGSLPSSTPGFSFSGNDFEVTGNYTQNDGIHIYYNLAVENKTSQGFQGDVVFRIYTSNEVTTTFETHYEQSDDYITNPSVSNWMSDGEYDYYEIDFGNRAVSPGEKVAVMGGISASSGIIDLSNDWSLAQLTGSETVLDRIVVFVGGVWAAGELPSGSTIQPATPTPEVTPTPTPDVLLGDVNGDGSVTIVDALMTAQYYVGLNPGGFNTSAADVNCDASVTIVDALMIAQYYVGLISTFC